MIGRYALRRLGHARSINRQCPFAAAYPQSRSAPGRRHQALRRRQRWPKAKRPATARCRAAAHPTTRTHPMHQLKLDSDLSKEVCGKRFALSAQTLKILDVCGDILFGREAGTQPRVSILKNRPHPTAPRAKRVRITTSNVGAVDHHAPARRVHNPDQKPSDNGPAAAGLAYHAERRTRINEKLIHPHRSHPLERCSSGVLQPIDNASPESRLSAENRCPPIRRRFTLLGAIASWPSTKCITETTGIHDATPQTSP